MSAYVILDLEIFDLAGFDPYRQRVVELVKRHGGRYLVVSDAAETLEGDWKPRRIVVIEFESTQRAKEWLNADEYRAIAPIRHRTARTNMILVEGTS
jgi:uncharacterized protein (DUF1330 family)